MSVVNAVFEYSSYRVSALLFSQLLLLLLSDSFLRSPCFSWRKEGVKEGKTFAQPASVSTRREQGPTQVLFVLPRAVCLPFPLSLPTRQSLHHSVCGVHGNVVFQK